MQFFDEGNDHQSVIEEKESTSSMDDIISSLRSNRSPVRKEEEHVDRIIDNIFDGKHEPTPAENKKITANLNIDKEALTSLV